MRIAQLTNKFSGEGIGGSERYCLSLSKELAKRHEVTIFACDTEDREIEGGIKVVGIGRSHDQIMRRDVFNPDIKLDIDADVVHVHGVWGISLAALGRVSRKAPVVLTVHDHWMFCPLLTYYTTDGEQCPKMKGGVRICSLCSTTLTGRSLFALREAIFATKPYDRFIDKYIAPSLFVKNLLIRNGIKSEKVIHLPHGIEPIGEKYMGVEKIVTYVGRLNPLKGIGYLERAFSKVRDRVSDAKLVIAGEGIWATETGADGIKMLGKISDRQKEKLFERSRVVVAPSIWPETFGLVILEAFSTARPVVASDVGAFSELVEDGKTGFLVKPKDEEELADKIVMLLADRKKAMDMGRRAFEFSKRFGISQHAIEIERIYDEVVSSRGNRR
ncbi:MAG: glycosyltransferase family 4 protein [Candidatus Micrarchaeia archaeon]